MSYYAGNIPPSEKAGMFPPGAYPPGAPQGTYLPTQPSGLRTAAPQPGYPSMTPGYPSMPTGYPPSSAYPGVQSAYPGVSAPGAAGAYQGLSYQQLASLNAPGYPGTQTYPSPQSSAGYPPSQLTSQSPYGSAPMHPSNPMYRQAPGYGMPMPTGQGYSISNPMYPASAAYGNAYPAPSPFRPPFP